MACFGEGAFANFLFAHEECVAGGLVGILGAVGDQGGKALLDEGGDVYDEGGADVGVEAGIEDFEGAVEVEGEGVSTLVRPARKPAS